ncbi:GNAT family N-acetyltransferase [Sphaerisporangium sp. NPDC049002]|uniref:GNAT family N-acetyltransferase n=1 Tax=unclassified Sphaerisporangium TaxID=2630420 RepID=UPI0033DAD92F
MRIRSGRAEDVPAVLAMYDSAVAWLAAEGRTGQWGGEPFSSDPARVELVTAHAASGGMRIAEVEGRPAGCAVLGAPISYIAPASEPELYVQALVIDQAFAGHAVGAALLRRARQEAVELGVSLLRVDCYAGGDGRLVKYYEGQGFTRSETFMVGDWPGQLLEMPLNAGSRSGDAREAPRLL